MGPLLALKMSFSLVQKFYYLAIYLFILLHAKVMSLQSAGPRLLGSPPFIPRDNICSVSFSSSKSYLFFNIWFKLHLLLKTFFVSFLLTFCNHLLYFFLDVQPLIIFIIAWISNIFVTSLESCIVFSFNSQFKF